MNNVSHIHKAVGILKILTRRRRGLDEDETEDITTASYDHDPSPHSDLMDDQILNLNSSNGKNDNHIDLSMEVNHESDHSILKAEDNEEDYIEHYDEDSYLDSLLDTFEDELDQHDVKQDEDDPSKIVFRDFPVEDGYVRIPIKFPGLNIAPFESPPPSKLWTAEDAFKEQVVPTLYMFVPSALLGFIIGMAVWIILLIIQRTFTSLRKSLQKNGKPEHVPDDEFIASIKQTLTEDPWKKISDAETVHALDGTTLKGDRAWQLRRQLRPGFGGSDRKPARKPHNLSTISSLSEGKRGTRKVSIGLNIIDHGS